MQEEIALSSFALNQAIILNNMEKEIMRNILKVSKSRNFRNFKVLIFLKYC